MTVLLVIMHVIICILLIILVLVQRGRGSGLVESFAGVESMFGTKTSAFLTRSTTILSIVFFFTCLSLAVISVRQSKSLLSNVKPQARTEPVTPAGSMPAAATQAAQGTPKTDQK